jgi:hypothetical protein
MSNLPNRRVVKIVRVTMHYRVIVDVRAMAVTVIRTLLSTYGEIMFVSRSTQITSSGGSQRSK